ncbi:MAG TPA: 2OG-Fe(II) oxygenase, partial [Candidatus Dormibacteraeota bacterium]
MTTVAERAAAVAWTDAERGMLEAGFARLPVLLTAPECAELRELYADDRRFRSRVDMARHRFGLGEYRYFDHPLPPVVDALRSALYPPLAGIANRWGALLGAGPRFP